MLKPLIFLDIDGVLNDHSFAVNGCSTIKQSCVVAMNNVIDAVDPEIVIHSSWRYMIHAGGMTLNGFSYMLETHGLKMRRDVVRSRIIGITRRDEGYGSNDDRAAQILAYEKPDRWVAIDNLPLSIEPKHFYQTNQQTGLTDACANKIIALLQEVPD